MGSAHCSKRACLGCRGCPPGLRLRSLPWEVCETSLRFFLRRRGRRPPTRWVHAGVGRGGAKFGLSALRLGLGLQSVLRAATRHGNRSVAAAAACQDPRVSQGRGVRLLPSPGVAFPPRLFLAARSLPSPDGAHPVGLSREKRAMAKGRLSRADIALLGLCEMLPSPG